MAKIVIDYIDKVIEELNKTKSELKYFDEIYNQSGKFNTAMSISLSNKYNTLRNTLVELLNDLDKESRLDMIKKLDELGIRGLRGVKNDNN